MSVNPVVLIQLLMDNYQKLTTFDDEPRTFVFQRNKRLLVHRETEEERLHRKSRLSHTTIRRTNEAICEKLRETLRGRAGKVWIDPSLRRIAVPLETATGSSGYGMLPTGSRIQIPNGKFIRAFTWWEKVDDIDLSVFALKRNGQQEEFSWRNMYGKQSEYITYSGDQTSGYYGGSEYFDVDLDTFQKKHPEADYLIFCNNVYSGKAFNECFCKAGFMLREEIPTEVRYWKGAVDCPRDVQALIYDPKTVDNAWRITGDGIFSYLFAIDLRTKEMVWLNLMRKDQIRVAGTGSMSWMRKYLDAVYIFSISDLYGYAGTLTEFWEEADIIISDQEELPDHGVKPRNPDAERIHSWDFEKMLELLRA